MEKERLKFCIERFDHYYDSVNNKSAVFLGLSTFIVGGLIAAYPFFLEHVNCSYWVHLLIAGLIGIGVAIMIIIITASTPFLASNTDSIMYFGSICSYSMEEFKEKSKSMTLEGEIDDLTNQVYQLSHGLKGKFQKLRLAAILFTIQFFLFIPLIILLILNLK